ncbi:MAG: STAS domain-containing protein [Bacillota bacterium]
MNIQKTQEGQNVVLKLAGRLDTDTAPALETAVKEGLDGVTSLRFDFSNLEYISSAGLRILLMAQKLMNKQGSMVIFGTNEGIDEIFEMTGFSDILTIEK